MSFTDEIKIKCPNCGYEESLKNFAAWEKDGKRGFLGKTREGFLMLLCQRCETIIQYDPMDDIEITQEGVSLIPLSGNPKDRTNFLPIVVIAIIVALIIISIRLLLAR